jgi:hypothetical protein
VIQPAVGWAKWLELPKEEVTEFLVELLGEEKRKDIEKGWRYARELEFKVNDTVRWKGKAREEWEKEVESYIKTREEVTRQELLREVFGGQVWLLELIVGGMEQKGRIESYFVKAGRGRPRKVYKLVAEVQQGVEAVAVGAEDFNQNNNSLLRAVGGGLEKGGISGSNGNTGIGEVESVNFYGDDGSGGVEGAIRERKEGRVGETFVKGELKDQQEGERIELPLELQRLIEKAERAQKERNLQRLAELFKGARWYEVELPSLLELYFTDRELGRLIERVLLLSGRRVDDVAKRVSKVLLLPIQVVFLRRYLSLRPVL